MPHYSHPNLLSVAKSIINNGNKYPKDIVLLAIEYILNYSQHKVNSMDQQELMYNPQGLTVGSPILYEGEVGELVSVINEITVEIKGPFGLKSTQVKYFAKWWHKFLGIKSYRTEVVSYEKTLHVTIWSIQPVYSTN